jgi:hypothetical protein
VHAVDGETPLSWEVKYSRKWLPSCATSGAHMTPGCAQAGGSGSASVGAPHWPTLVPERTGTFCGTWSWDVKR